MLGETNFHTRKSFPEVGQKQKMEKKKERMNDGNNNGQATHGARKHAWGKHRSFPEVGQKQKTERKEREKERKTERW